MQTQSTNRHTLLHLRKTERKLMFLAEEADGGPRSHLGTTPDAGDSDTLVRPSASPKRRREARGVEYQAGTKVLSVLPSGDGLRCVVTGYGEPQDAAWLLGCSSSRISD